MKERVLELLAEKEGNYISGSEISRRLGISRTAVWKHINTLRQEGYQIDSQTNRGYLLIKSPDLLLPQEIKRGLASCRFGQEIIYLERVDSTNQKAKELAVQGREEGMVVIAEEQLEGRGSLGRSWSSPKGKGLWFSLILRPPISPLDTPKLTLVAAVALAKAVKRFAGIDLKIKWPNDLLYGKRKVAGILTELAAEFGQVDYVIVGIGINVNLTDSDYPEELKETAGSLKMITGKTYNRAELLRVILLELERAYFTYLNEGFAPIRSDWCTLAGTLQTRVRITDRNGSFEGIAEKLDEEGRLLVRLPDNTIRAVLAGEVNLLGER
ncbi:MAG TPA: biotin--[acetyl-CoA-carboxylase] ligase [Clostridia bacterium]|nr:biotin--[acetyl-CoA-carboxylase] ligase [Clostridia bacterium]